MNDELLRSLSEAINQQTEVLKGLGDNGLHTKTPAATTSAAMLHGNTGVFRGPGLERDVITAHIRSHGMSSVLPMIPTVSQDPRFASLTGYTATSGTEPTNACDDAPAGYVKGCNLTARFGLLRRDTQTIEMDDVMLKVNRGDFTDLVLRGRVLGLTDNLVPSGMNEAQALNILTMSEMIGAGVQAERALNTRYWQGTVAAGQMPGLDSQIATGQVDADTNQACTALDSDVKDFEYNDVCGTARDIVEYMSMMAYYLEYNAVAMGLDPVQWVIAMRPQLWFELSACWPCKYLTDRCKTANVGFNAAVINDNVNISERDRMRANMVIPINGRDYPVITDTGIFENDNINNANLNAGEYASSIYFVPLTMTGGFPTTYVEYLDYRQAGSDRALLQGREDWWWTDAGSFSWAIEQTKWCYKLSLKTERRVVLRTPQLAGKIDYVRYTPLQHLREPDPASPYHQDGGVSLRPPGTSYAVWL
jgi:hypothetical protein